ncbi:MAG TPA: TIGR01777 family protein, partial [Bacteroidales bacterium]|nr:TIGR01777 family protein [Bacteroidales bacterium]
LFSTWLVREIEKSDVVINLTGEDIASKPWTRRRRMQLIRSRLGTTRALAKACHYAEKKPKVFIQGSAIGFYPLVEGKKFTEKDEPGTNFLARLTTEWEQIAKLEVPKEVRLVVVRTGIVLSAKGGMLPKLLKPIRLFVGGWFGTGEQTLSWIHITDEVRAIIYLMNDSGAKGYFNLTSPNPVSQKTLVKTAGKTIKRPTWIPIPSFAVKLLLGQMADEVLLKGSHVAPTRLAKRGFEFTYPNIDLALASLLKRKH